MIPRFETERLLLRGVTEDDAPAYQRHFADYEVVRHLANVVPWPYPADGAATFIKDSILPAQGQNRWVWGIFRRSVPGELIGAIDLRKTDVRDQRGFWLGRAFWGKGYMSEALGPVMDHAFAELGFERMIVSNALGNNRSRAVKLRGGAKLLGVEPAAFVDPRYTQKEVWQIDAADWRLARSVSS